MYILKKNYCFEYVFFKILALIKSGSILLYMSISRIDQGARAIKLCASQVFLLVT